MPAVAVVGAGVAGLAAARVLAGAGVDVQVFERETTAGGRVATGHHAGAAYDFGAQLFRAESAAAARMIFEELPRDDLVDIGRDVWTFDASGAIVPGDPALNADPKWVYRGGLDRLPALLAEPLGERLHLSAPVEAITRSDGTWSLELRGGRRAAAESLLITTPGPVAARLLAGAVGPEALDGLAALPYRAIIAAVFGFRPRPALARPFYALVNSDRAHAISWLAFEDDKPGYVPKDESVVVAQMADAWSSTRLDRLPPETAGEALPLVRALLPALPAPVWTAVHVWPHALPSATLEPATLDGLAGDGLFFAGDGFAGARLHLALESGVAAANRILALGG